MPTPTAFRFCIITSRTTSEYSFGIMYTDGMVLTVAPENRALPRLLTSALIASRGLRLTSVAIETTDYPAPATSKSNDIQPCTIVYPNGEVVAAIESYGNLIFRGATVSFPDAAITTPASSEILKGAAIYSRRGVNGRPWGSTTPTGTATPTPIVPYSGYAG